MHVYIYVHMYVHKRRGEKEEKEEGGEKCICERDRVKEDRTEREVG